MRVACLILITPALFWQSCSGISTRDAENHPAPPQRTLVWADEFEEGSLPDTTRWTYDTGGHGWGNHELQYYTSRRPENARVENGNLVIEARREPYEGNAYSSARLVTRGLASWKFGEVEVRAKLPTGLGTWPAIWMLGDNEPLQWPEDGEIDIMEHVGYDPGVVHASIHCQSFNHRIGTQKTATIPVADFADSFHVYHLKWSSDSLHIGIDGNDYFHFGNTGRGYDDWPFDHPFYLLLNLAVGGDWGGQKGVDTTIWPKQMLVDYVRVYRYEP